MVYLCVNIIFQVTGIQNDNHMIVNCWLLFLYRWYLKKKNCNFFKYYFYLRLYFFDVHIVGLLLICSVRWTINIPYVCDFRFIHMLSCMSATENWDGSHKCKVYFHDLFLMHKKQSLFDDHSNKCSISREKIQKLLTVTTVVISKSMNRFCCSYSICEVGPSKAISSSDSEVHAGYGSHNQTDGRKP